MLCVETVVGEQMEWEEFRASNEFLDRSLGEYNMRKLSWHPYHPRLRLQARAAWHVPWSHPDTPVVKQDKVVNRNMAKCPKVAQLAFAK